MPQDFWLTARVAAQNGSLNVALGLYIYAIEEVGKFVVLFEALSGTRLEDVMIDGRVFKDHRFKLKKGISQFEEMEDFS
jgi:AbiV family abortive infection protein